MKRFVPLLVLLLLLCGCQNKAYDTDNLVMKATLFEEGISVPVGNAGPFNLELAMQVKTVASLLGSSLETEYDGTILCRTDIPLGKRNIYQIVSETEDQTQPTAYTIGYRSDSPSTLAGLLQSFGFWAVDQHISIVANNPLDVPYTVNGSVFVKCQDVKKWQIIYEKTEQLDGFTIPRTYGDVSLLNLHLPEDVHFTPSSVGFSDFVLNLPANLRTQLRSSNNQDFVFNGKYTCHISAGENTEIPLGMLGFKTVSVNFGLPVGAYELKEVEASFTLENTLPLQVTLSNIRLMTGEKPAIDEKLEVSPEQLVVLGGSTHEPGSTPVTLKIKSKEGAIPDITGLSMDLDIVSAPGHAKTRLSLKQGISVKSAKATLRGGITLGINE